MDENKLNNEVVQEVVAEAKPVAETPQVKSGFKRSGNFQRSKKEGSVGRGSGGAKRPEKPRAEFESKAIDVRRVTRVVAGGRRFSYSVATVVGDRKGHVGFGIGKSVDTSMAMDKAYRAAVKKMITLRLTKNFSIPYEVNAKFNASKISLMPNKGRGLIAGSSARIILSLAGVKDVTAKYNSGSKNRLNNAKVTMEALKHFGIPFERSHKPKEDRTESVRKFLGRDRRNLGGNEDTNQHKRPARKSFIDDKPKQENPIDKITI